MQATVSLSKDIQDLLCCPICHAALNQTEVQFECAAPACSAHFPLVEGVPVLINEQSSLFSIGETVSQNSSQPPGKSGGFKKALARLLPDIGDNIKGAANYRRFGDLLIKQSALPKILVIGGRILGRGMELLAANPKLELVETDIAFGPRTRLICDAHDIPFQDRSFDGVIVQAVLEHVVDPYRCCEEIHRVLKPQGLVYAETPFMQQVHAGRYDFTRFTHLGHRRLFRRFEEIDSGAVCGPGMALAWSYQFFLLSFVTSRLGRKIMHGLARATAFYLKYFDRLLIGKPGALDAASACYFLGRKSTQTLSDRELIKLYRGSHPQHR